MFLLIMFWLKKFNFMEIVKFEMEFMKVLDVGEDFDVKFVD